MIDHLDYPPELRSPEFECCSPHPDNAIMRLGKFCCEREAGHEGSHAIYMKLSVFLPGDRLTPGRLLIDRGSWPAALAA